MKRQVKLAFELDANGQTRLGMVQELNGRLGILGERLVCTKQGHITLQHKGGAGAWMERLADAQGNRGSREQLSGGCFR